MTDIDDIAVGDVVKNMSESVFRNDDLMKQLFKVYQASFNKNPKYKLLKHYDFGKYKLVGYDFDLTYSIGDVVVLTILNHKNDIPTDFEAKVIDNDLAQINGLNIRFNKNCVRFVISKI